MSVRANIVFDDDIWEALQQTPRGERSRAVNEAVGEWLRRKRRAEASARIQQRRTHAQHPGKSAEALIAEDRAAH
ncbi:hypothetical protein [Algiphilus sp.]|uniref:hypothetical protein n=1 Tax=Algiphilus sp. TaxID=1872431 RepID=UPI003C3AD9C7